VRWLLLGLITLGACFEPLPDDDGYYDDDLSTPDDDWTSDDAVIDYGCTADDQCATAEVCGRDHYCYAPESVMTVTVNWTLSGAAPDELSCMGHTRLEIEFESSADTFGYAPVPCELGRFTVTKLPGQYNRVWLGIPDSVGTSMAIPESRELALDLPF
jgi:hypothetical protein